MEGIEDIKLAIEILRPSDLLIILRGFNILNSLNILIESRFTEEINEKIEKQTIKKSTWLGISLK